MPQNPLTEIIAARIAEHGPMSVAEYMQLALAHPEYGYYMTKDPLGAAGDFTTAPEISQVFGELIGLWLAQSWLAMGKPECALVELGPGRGTLMADILRATKHIQGFHAAISVHLVEMSPVLKQKQWKTLAGKHPQIVWHEHFSEILEKPLLLVANEFFDALPVRQFVDGVERMIEMGDGKLAFSTSPLPLREGFGGGVVPNTLQSNVRQSPPTLPSPSRGEGVIETCEPAEHIMHNIATRIAQHGGAALIIDYGYAEGHGDTLQAVRNHEYCDVLSEPGMADITAHVDFAALKKAAEGVATYGPIPQGAFLTRMGVAERTAMLAANATDAQIAEIYTGVKRLTDPKQMGELFKVLALTSTALAKPEGF